MLLYKLTSCLSETDTSKTEGKFMHFWVWWGKRGNEYAWI